MTPYLVTSFFTLNTGYEKEARERLIPSLERFGIPHYVVGIESKGPWGRNIYEKANVIQNAMRKYADHNVVWLDADAEVCASPALFETGCEGADFAYHNRRGHLSSGTMFFRNRYQGRKLVEHWASRLCFYRNTWEGRTEQAVLKELLPAHDTLKIFDLPLSYSTIFDGPQPEEDVVIRHHQASRRLKKKSSQAQKNPVHSRSEDVPKAQY